MEINPVQFERLLLEFCKQDLPPDFTVEHDIKAVGEESGNKRQIDVRIKGRLGISEILICGEAKNWNAEVGIETIDALVGKYLSGEIRANKVILFSNKGFTAPVIERAKKVGIELLQPKILGQPVRTLPYFVSIGYLAGMVVEITHMGPQETFMQVNADQYIILKGKERLSFPHFVYRMAVNALKKLPELNIRIEVGKINLKDDNVLYELKDKPGYRYNANFSVETSLKWDFFVENLEASVLHHVNTNKDLQINLQGTDQEVLEKVLMSTSKRNYGSRHECIMVESAAADHHFLLVCISDPDQLQESPNNPVLTII